MLTTSSSVLRIRNTQAPARPKTGAKPALHGTTAAHATRRELGLQMLTIGTSFLAVAGNSAAADTGRRPADETANSNSSSSGGSFITIAPINSKAKEFMDMRDEAMAFQCSGGMFDCDGDRREFAHKQYMDWLESGGVPKRIREGNPKGPKSF